MLPSLLRGSRRKDHLTKTVSRDSYFEPLTEDKMDCVFDECRKSLWYAFDTLVDQTTGTAHKTSLKVIISNVGLALGFDKSEEILDDNVGDNVDFVLFYNLIHTEIFEKLKATSSESLTLSGADAEEVHSKCWMLWSNKSAYRNGKKRNVGDEDAYKLWRIFNLFAETDSSRTPKFPIEIHPEEAQYILNHFIQITGQVAKEPRIKQIGEQTECLTFEDFLNLFDTEFATSLPKTGLSQGIKEIFDQIILDTLKKGMVCKRGHHYKNWKDRWFVLTPKHLRYYKTHSENEHDKKGDIALTKDCTIEVLPERSGPKVNRFVLHTPTKPYEMSVADLKTRNEWIAAMQKALDFCEENVQFQREDANERRALRETKRSLEAEEERKRREEAELLAKREEELDKERQAREELEERLRQEAAQREIEQQKAREDEERRRQEEAALLANRQEELEKERRLHEEDQRRHQEELEAEKKAREEQDEKWRQEAAEREKRLRELEEIAKELERLLEEERQAKRDEEIVRALQARILEEETVKREELEKIKAEQERLLHAERERREGLEEQKQEQENQLLEAQTRLEQLELDRLAADDQLREVAEKLQKTERDRMMLEAKEKLWRKPTGLARLVEPTVKHYTTHRGEGAFPKDFLEEKTYEKGSFGEESSEEKDEGVEITDDKNIQDGEDLQTQDPDSP